MRPYSCLSLVPVVVALSLAGCGAEESTTASSTPTTTAEAATTVETTTTAEATAEKPSGPKCRTPDGTVLGSLRFRLREGGQSGELVDGAWAQVRTRGINYLAAETESDGPQSIVLVSFPETGQYLRAMKAVNGTARTKMPDLPEGPDAMPKGAQAALDCLDQ